MHDRWASGATLLAMNIINLTSLHFPDMFLLVPFYVPLNGTLVNNHKIILIYISILLCIIVL